MSTDDRRSATRAKLIDAAADAIAEKGFQRVTLDQIAAKAGLTKGAIYDNFESKEALFFAVIAARPSSIPWPAGDKSAPLRQRAKAFAQAVVEDEAARGQAPLRAEFLLYSLAHPEMQPAINAWLVEGFRCEEAALREQFAPDELPVSPDRFIILLQALLPGLAFLRSQAPSLITDEAIRDIVIALFATKSAR